MRAKRVGKHQANAGPMLPRLVQVEELESHRRTKHFLDYSPERKDCILVQVATDSMIRPLKDCRSRYSAGD